MFQRLRVSMPEGAAIDRIPALMVDLLAIVLRTYERFAMGTQRLGHSGRQRLEVPVTHPSFWTRPDVHDDLCSVLESYWGQRCDIVLTSEGEPPDIAYRLDRLQPRHDACQPARVIVLAPTIDVLAALVQQPAPPPGQLVLVTMEMAGDRQIFDRSWISRLLASDRFILAAGAVGDEPAGSQVPGEALELLHVVLAAAVAASLGQSQVWFHENGVANLQLPITAAALAGQPTRSLHPAMLTALGRLLTAVTDSPFTIENPYLALTPAEVAGELRQAAGDPQVTSALAVLAATTHHQSHALDRSIALGGAVLAAGGELAHEDERIWHQLIRPMDERLADAYIHAIRELPELPDGELARRLLDMPASNTQAHGPGQELAVRLFHRHVESTRQVLARGVRSFAQQLTQGMLPSTCLIARATLPREAQLVLAREQPAQCAFRKRADRWELQYDSDVPLYLNDSKGLTYIHVLLQHPHRAYSANELRAIVSSSSTRLSSSTLDASVDREALRMYKLRLDELHEELDAANAHCDIGRADRLQVEIDAIRAELRRALGRGGNQRKVGDYERARKSISNAIHRALSRITREHPALASHLTSSLQIGAYLSYAPDAQIAWLT